MSIRALAFAAGAAALAFAAPALAGGETSSSTSTTTTRDADGHVERVIVLTDHRDRHGGDEAEASADGSRHRVRVLTLDGAGRPECGDHALVDNSSQDGKEKTRVIICGDHEVSVADRATRLEHALERIQQMDGLSDGSKERVTAALRQAIDELRNAH